MECKYRVLRMNREISGALCKQSLSTSYAYNNAHSCSQTKFMMYETIVPTTRPFSTVNINPTFRSVHNRLIVHKRLILSRWDKRNHSIDDVMEYFIHNVSLQSGKRGNFIASCLLSKTLTVFETLISGASLYDFNHSS